MAATLSPTRLLPSGDRAITGWNSAAISIDAAQTTEVLALDQTLAREPISGSDRSSPDLSIHAGSLRSQAPIDFRYIWATYNGLYRLARRCSGSCSKPRDAPTRQLDSCCADLTCSLPRLGALRAWHRLEDRRQEAETLRTETSSRAHCGRHTAVRDDGLAGLSLSQRSPGFAPPSPRRQNTAFADDRPGTIFDRRPVEDRRAMPGGPERWNFAGAETARRNLNCIARSIFLLEPGDRVTPLTFRWSMQGPFREQDRAAEHGENRSGLGRNE